MAGNDDLWEMYNDKRGEHRWRRRASCGKIVGSSCEGYVKKSDCQKNAQRHGMDGNPNGLGAKDKWDIYQDNAMNIDGAVKRVMAKSQALHQ